jgi:hypothetical protein
LITTIPTGRPGDRARRIEMVAAIVLGRDPDDPARAAKGWMAKLSRAMGLSHSVVSSTMSRSSDDAFDRRLRGFIAGTRFQMAEDLHTLETLEQIFGAADAQRADFATPYTDAWEGDTE